MIRRLIWVLSVVAALAVGVATLLIFAIGDASNPVAATLVDGRPALVVTLCEGEGVQSVFVTDSRSQDGEGPTLWRIQAAGRSVRQDIFVIGEVPEGFVEVAPLAGEIPQHEVTAWAITDSNVEMISAVDFRRVLEGKLYVDLEPISQVDFHKKRFCS